MQTLRPSRRRAWACTERLGLQTPRRRACMQPKSVRTGLALVLCCNVQSNRAPTRPARVRSRDGILQVYQKREGSGDHLQWPGAAPRPLQQRRGVATSRRGSASRLLCPFAEQTPSRKNGAASREGPQMRSALCFRHSTPTDLPGGGRWSTATGPRVRRASRLVFPWGKLTRKRI